ncbi:hypothetical protein ACIBSS_28895 [Micromonospora aurantiaca]|uniref:pPIWI_RE_Y domain-containing protein n=1 Tax=Micromonospora aurantiaca (nom. illeg.) TaxID=47850 RepID=UPI0037BA1328
MGGRSAVARRGVVTDGELTLSLAASGVLRLTAWPGPEDPRSPYPTALQLALDRLTWACWNERIDPPRGVADLVSEWCSEPLARWPLDLPDGAVGPGDRLLVDGEASETCRDWAVTNPDVISEVMESRFMSDVRDTCRGMGRRGQEVYVRLRRLMVDEPVLSAVELLKRRNQFPDVPAWSQWLGEAYVPVTANELDGASVGVCRRCRQLARPASGGWRCATPRCRRLTRPTAVTVREAKGVLRLRPDLVTYVSLPGRAEADLVKTLERAGATVYWWPDVDAYDLLVVWPDGRRWAVDVKDWRSPYPLARKLRPLPTYRRGHEYAWDEGFIVIPTDRVNQRRGYLTILRRHSEALRTHPELEAVSVKQLKDRIPEGCRGA